VSGLVRCTPHGIVIDGVSSSVHHLQRLSIADGIAPAGGLEQGRAALAGGGLIVQQKTKAADEANRLRKDHEEAERLAKEREENMRLKRAAMRKDQQETLAMQTQMQRDTIAAEKAAMEKLADHTRRKEAAEAAKEVRSQQLSVGLSEAASLSFISLTFVSLGSRLDRSSWTRRLRLVYGVMLLAIAFSQ
jgi:hypothetical protein